jgi:hypothetical protein
MERTDPPEATAPAVPSSLLGRAEPGDRDRRQVDSTPDGFPIESVCRYSKREERIHRERLQSAG